MKDYKPWPEWKKFVVTIFWAVVVGLMLSLIPRPTHKTIWIETLICNGNVIHSVASPNEFDLKMNGDWEWWGGSYNTKEGESCSVSTNRKVVTR